MAIRMLQKIAGIIPTGIRKEQEEKLNKEMAAARDLQNLMHRDEWRIQLYLEDQVFNEAINGLRKPGLTEALRLRLNEQAATIDNLRLARKTVLKQGEIAEQTLNRLTRQKEKKNA